MSIISQEEVQALINSEVQKLLPNLTESIIKNVTKATNSRISEDKKPEEKVEGETVVH